MDKRSYSSLRVTRKSCIPTCFTTSWSWCKMLSGGRPWLFEKKISWREAPRLDLPRRLSRISSSRTSRSFTVTDVRLRKGRSGECRRGKKPWALASRNIVLIVGIRAKTSIQMAGYKLKESRALDTSRITMQERGSEAKKERKSVSGGSSSENPKMSSNIGDPSMSLSWETTSWKARTSIAL